MTKTPYIKPPKACRCDFCKRAWHRQGSWWERTSVQAKDLVTDFKRKGLRLLSYGKDRIVFAHKGFVLKVPRSYKGTLANQKELRMYRKYGKNRDPQIANYARCRLWRGVLVMERVKCARLLPSYILPNWTKFIDSSQVGHDIKGRLVAYDFG